MDDAAVLAVSTALSQSSRDARSRPALLSLVVPLILSHPDAARTRHARWGGAHLKQHKPVCRLAEQLRQRRKVRLRKRLDK